MSSPGDYEPVSGADHDRAEAARPSTPAAAAAAVGSLLHYVRSSDGKLAPLIVQSFQDAPSLPPTRLWQRVGTTPPSSPTTTLGKMSYWIGAPVMRPGSAELHLADGRALGQAVLRLVVSWPLSCFLFYGFEFMSPPFQSAFQTPGIQLALPDARYQPARHLGARDARGQSARPAESSNAPLTQRRAYTDDIDLDTDITAVPRNSGEDEAHTILVETSDQGAASRPRHLCYIRDPAVDEYETINVSQFLDKEGDDIDMEFVFVSYTREQFRVATDEEIDAYTGYPDEATREANRQLAQTDRAVLIQWGLDAARRAGKRAFWIDFECVRDRDGVARTSSKSDDVYRICDVVRAAHSMIIATGPPASEKVAAILAGQEACAAAAPAARQQATTKWLRHWGSRLWTLPELLLCPSEHRVQLYVLGGNGDAGSSEAAAALAKRNFAERAWDDAALVKELVNHYEGSAILSEIRLVETALACFARRGTHRFSPGDIAYALMGLLPMSQRPAVHPGDSGFQAFARLSLANDGGAFLSRMLCLLPPTPHDDNDDDAEWYDSVNDVWGARIRDVHPGSRVIGIASDAPDTLVVDGAPGAAVCWDALDAGRQGELPTSTVLLALLVWSAGFGLGAVVVLRMAANVASGGGDIWGENGLPGAAAVLCAVVFGLPALAAPLLYLWYQRGNRRQHMPARIVGLEGYVDAGAVERHLWGHDNGLLTLATDDDDGGAGYQDDDGSNSSRSSSAAPRPRRRAERFHFTLVDTHMMTVRHVAARKPPVAVFAMGSAGGAQRAMLCSYDWRDDTFERETVVRVENTMVDQMRRIDQFRVRLRSSCCPPGDEQGQDNVGPAGDGVVARDTVRPWQRELLFAFFVLMAMDMLGQLYWDPRKSYDIATHLNMAYTVAFLLAQAPAYFLVTRLSLQRVMPQLVLIKAFLPGFLTLLTNDLTGHIFGSIITGTVEGVAYPVLAALVWLWFSRTASPASLTARALVFAALPFVLPLLGHHALRRLLGHPALYRFVAYLGDVVGVVLHVGVATVGRRCIGRPDEVAWLPASLKVKMAAPASPVRRPPKTKQAAVVPLVLCAVTLLAHLATDAPRGFAATAPLLWLLYLYGAMVVLFTMCAARFPKSITLLLVITMVASSAGSLWKNSRQDDRLAWPGILADVRILILPLIWVLANTMLETWPPKLQVLCLSLAGMALDSMLKTMDVMFTWQTQASAGAAAIVLLVALWVYEETSRRGRITL